MGIGEADAFSERLKQELVALEAANVYQLLESEPLIEEVSLLGDIVLNFCALIIIHYSIRLPFCISHLPWSNNY
jgi:hypothetical protein